MNNIISILALSLFIVGVILLLDKSKLSKKLLININKEGLKFTESFREGMPGSGPDDNNESRMEVQESRLDDQNKYYTERKIPKMVDQEQRITNIMEIDEKKSGNTLKPKQIIDGVGNDKSDIAKEVEKCRIIDQVGNCDLIAGTKCGYCLSSNKILYGDQNGPLVDSCKPNTPGKFDEWSPPGRKAPEICTKLKERAICNAVKDCGDVGGYKQICSWCPVKGKGMVKKINSEGGFKPKYPEDDKCDWPYNKWPNDKQSDKKWFGWNGKQKDTRTYATRYIPTSLISRPNESTGSYINSYSDLKQGFIMYKTSGARYARWDAAKGMWNFHRAGSSDTTKNPKVYRVDNWTAEKYQTGGKLSVQTNVMDNGGDCDRDDDCPTGWKCGQRGTQNLPGIKGLYGKDSARDYCYDPNVKALHGPLVPLDKCATFEQNFPCMTPNLLTGPHTVACYQDLWSKSGCSGDVMQRAGSNATGKAALKNWNKSSYTVVGDNMKGFTTVSKSDNYEKANTATAMCYGKEVDPCESRFVNKFQKKSRPRQCIDKMFKDAGCSKDGKIHPDNIKKWKKIKGGGIPDKWEENQNYGWTAYGYRGKLKEIRRNAIKYKGLMGSGGDVMKMNSYADQAIYYNELCYGKTPKVPTIEGGSKPCWKDFVELVIRSHKKVRHPDSETLLFNKNDMEVGKNYMNDSNIFRRTLGKLGLIGQDWGDQKRITKSMYEKKHFPYWKFYANSRNIYNRKPIWNEFKKRVKIFPGVKVTTDSVQFDENNQMALIFKQYKLMPKDSDRTPKNGKCPSCDLVPCGQCQAGCPISTCPDGTKNMCSNGNRGKKPTMCDLPPKFTITRKLWLDSKFPYWAFMRVLQRFEKK